MKIMFLLLPFLFLISTVYSMTQDNPQQTYQRPKTVNVDRGYEMFKALGCSSTAFMYFAAACFTINRLQKAIGYSDPRGNPYGNLMNGFQCTVNLVAVIALLELAYSKWQTALFSFKKYLDGYTYEPYYKSPLKSSS